MSSTHHERRSSQLQNQIHKCGASPSTDYRSSAPRKSGRHLHQQTLRKARTHDRGVPVTRKIRKLLACPSTVLQRRLNQSQLRDRRLEVNRTSSSLNACESNRGRSAHLLQLGNERAKA